MWLNPEAKDHRKRGKLRIGRDVYCGCGREARVELKFRRLDSNLRSEVSPFPWARGLPS